MQEEDSEAPNPPKKSGKRRSSKGKNKVVGFSQWFFSLVYHLGQISSRPLGPQNLAEEGDYFREIQVDEMLSFWPDIFLGITFTKDTKEGGLGSLQPMFFL